MGLLDAIGGGIAQAAEGLAATSHEQIRAQIDQDRQAALMQMKAQTDLEMAPKMEEARLGAQEKVADAARTKIGAIYEEGAAGLDPSDQLGILQSQANLLNKRGYTKEADALMNRLDKMQDNVVQKDFREWQMKSGDRNYEASREDAANQLKMEKQKISQQGAKLNLDRQEKAEAKSAMDAYITAYGNFSMLDPKTTDQATFKAATVAKEMAAIELLKYGIKVGGESSGNQYESKVIPDDDNLGQSALVTLNKNTGAKTIDTASTIRNQGGRVGQGGAPTPEGRASQFRVIRDK